MIIVFLFLLILQCSFPPGSIFSNLEGTSMEQNEGKERGTYRLITFLISVSCNHLPFISNSIIGSFL